MAGDVQITEATIRADLLDYALTDCMGFPEFFPGIVGEARPAFPSTEKVNLFRTTLAKMIDEGLVYVHAGLWQLERPHDSVSNRLTSAEFLEEDPAMWTPEPDRRLYLCWTELTADAFGREHKNASEYRGNA